MKLKITRIVKIICFLMVTVLVINSMTNLLKPKWLENRWKSSKTNISFYELEENSAEVLFFGASVISAAVDPYQLYEDYGISSYNLGVMSQPMIATYYWFKEALKTQKMKLAVVEIKSAGRTSEKAERKARKSYDYMKWGLNKLEYALDYKIANGDEDAELDLWSYLFPLSMYHTRWSELTYDDYDFFLGNNDSKTKGLSVLSTHFKDDEEFNIEKNLAGKYDGFEVNSDELEEPNPVNSNYAKKILDLAKKNDVEVLFVRTPDYKWNVKQHNYIQKLADEYKINFVDMNLKSWREDNNYVYSEDSADIIHTNILGTKKITSYLGKYITENYKLTDFRKGNNSIKKDFEAGKPEYEAEIKEGMLEFVDDLDEYLEEINDDNYEVIIVAGPKADTIEFSKNQRKLLNKLGAENSLFDEFEFGKNIICVLNNEKNITKITKQNSSLSKKSSVGGTLSDGTDYSIKIASKQCGVRFNDSEYEGIEPEEFNIIVFDKNLNRVVSSVYLKSNDGCITINKGE